MKILMVSNLYPPYYVGGYELRCSLVAEGLHQRGHDVRVLTSRFGLSPEAPLKESVGGVPVERVFRQYHHGPQAPFRRPYFLSRVRPQLEDARHFIRVLDEFKPDIVNWWSISGLTKAILPIARLKGISDVFCVDDDWIIEEQTQSELGERPPWAGLWKKDDKPWYWRPLFVWLMERWKSSLLKERIVTSAVPFCPTHVSFVSEFLRADYETQGFRFPSAEVVYGGVPAAKFFFERGAAVENGRPIRLLYAGQIYRDRGLHTVIEALGLLPPKAYSLAALTVVGDSFDVNYQREVREQVRALNLSEKVMFIGKKSYDEMPEIYRSHDLLITPSLRKEGLPFTMMEAMLSGCAVVTTGSGGAIEIARLADLPLFPKADAAALSRVLEDLIADRRALARIAKRGQEVALREFTSDRMTDRFVEVFQGLCETAQKRVLQDDCVLKDSHKVEPLAHSRL